MWEGEHPDGSGIETRCPVFPLKLDYLRGNLLGRIYGLIIPNNKVPAGLSAPVAASLNQSSGSTWNHSGLRAVAKQIQVLSTRWTGERS